MEKPQKPELEKQQRVGEFGEIVVELTQDSERRWAKYLQDIREYKKGQQNGL